MLSNDVPLGERGLLSLLRLVEHGDIDLNIARHRVVLTGGVVWLGIAQHHLVAEERRLGISVLHPAVVVAALAVVFLFVHVVEGVDCFAKRLAGVNRSAVLR